MPYNYPESTKTSSVAILGFVRDRADLKECVCVLDVADFLKDVEYTTNVHRINDASTRLRTLERSGYVKKVKPDYEDSRVFAGPLHKRLQEKKEADKKERKADNTGSGGRGRPPAIYALTDAGAKYARTIADIYLTGKGVPIEREGAMRSIHQAYIVLDETFTRAFVVSESPTGAMDAFMAWADKVGKQIKIKEALPVILDRKDAQQAGRP